MQCSAATVAAILTRRRDESAPQYQRGIQAECWEVVLPELIFTPRAPLPERTKHT